MAATPIRGEKVTRLRMPVMLARPSPGPRIECEAEQAGHAQQHHEGVVVDIAGLHLADAAAQARRDEGDAVGTQAVDQLLVAAFPEEVAQSLGATHEDKVVKL